MRESDLTQQTKVQVEQKFFAKSFRKFEMCTEFLNYCNATLTVSHSEKVQGVAIIFKHFNQKFFFLRAFQAPLKSNIKFQGFSRTSRSSTNHAPNTTSCPNELTRCWTFDEHGSSGYFEFPVNKEAREIYFFCSELRGLRRPGHLAFFATYGFPKFESNSSDVIH